MVYTFGLLGGESGMPWKESSVMDERIRFVIRLKDGESMASLCREFGISRKTGYKIFERYEECGLEGLSDRCRRPFRYANQLPEQVEATIAARSQDPGGQHDPRRAGPAWTGHPHRTYQARPSSAERPP